MVGSEKQEEKVSQQDKEKSRRLEGIRRITNYHHKDPLSSSVIYLGVGLSSWSCVAVVNGMCAIPTLHDISHKLTNCSVHRHHWERDVEYQKARRHFGHACHETLPLPRKKGLVYHTTQYLVGLINYHTQTPSECHKVMQRLDTQCSSRFCVVLYPTG